MVVDAAPAYVPLLMALTTVLVVDDSAEDAAAMARIVRGVQRVVSVITCGSGAEALMWLNGNQPHLIVLDLRMPGMDGFEFLDRIKDNAVGVPVVVVAGMLTAADIDGCERCGAVAIVRKEVELQTFVDRLSAALRPWLGRES